MKNAERDKPYSLLIMEYLNHRSSLSRIQEKYYASLKKGWEGEKQFDTLLEKIPCDHIILKDLLFKVSGTVFQIDTLLITNETLYLYEVKNYEGEYMMENNRLIQCTSKKEVLNPTIQLERSATLLRQLLDKFEIDLTLEAYVVYINSHFTLYQLSSNQYPFILPSMIDAHLNMLGRNRKKLAQRHRDWASYLYNEQLDITPYLDLPEYTYEELTKGILCSQCHASIQQFTGRLVICPVCHYKETSRLSVRSHIKEYIRLFPQRKVTLSAIRNWCGHVPSAYTIRAGIKDVRSESHTGV
ncbi:nuclease-related domain-containing protein [Alkalibacterium putridalgicola]|uniref:nuclease-related domain-containing protein n=1 Tax=Alkalibacterium putridalgicola TaxID=426703 RepID=UPI0034CE457F